MEYHIKAKSSSKSDASINIKESKFGFGISPDRAELLANPAEIFLGSLSACILKNVERFSGLMKFEYSRADIHLKAERLDNPPRMDNIEYELKIYSEDSSLNIPLLKKNIEKFGTIFNTVKSSCNISGSIKKVSK